jgi:transcriptional regulator with XRE-family HTH domain
MGAAIVDQQLLWTSSQQVASFLRRMAEEREAESKRIGSLIAGLRVAQGLSQEDLARKVDVGVGTVSRWERGKHEGYGKNVRKLAKVLKVTPAVLRPVEPDTESQLDRIEGKLDELTALLTDRRAEQALTALADQLDEIDGSRSLPGPDESQSPPEGEQRRSA